MNLSSRKPAIKTCVLALLFTLSLTAHAADGSHKHDFPVAVAGFHDVMAPLWHSPSGSERAQQICKQYPDLVTQLENIRRAKVPDNVIPDQWQHAIENIQKVLSPIKSHCANGRTPEYALANVHEGFHDLVQLIGHDE